MISFKLRVLPEHKDVVVQTMFLNGFIYTGEKGQCQDDSCTCDKSFRLEFSDHVDMKHE